MKNFSIFLSFALIAILTFLLNGCASTPSLVEKYAIGNEYTGSIEFSNKSVPLPEGKWRIVGSGKGGPRDFFLVIILIKETSSKKLEDNIIIHVETFQNEVKSGYTKSEEFERTDLLYVDVKNNKNLQPQDAWLIAPTRMEINIKLEPYKKAYQYFIDNKYILPKILIGSKHRFTGKYIKNKYLSVYYYRNPEAAGFERPTDSNLQTSDWSPLNITQFPDKVAYIEQLKIDSAAYHKKLKEGFGE